MNTKLKKINFVPVLNGSILNCAVREDLYLNNKRATFYTKDGLYQYNTFLINPFHHQDIFEKIMNNGLIDRDKSLIFADSGGLQEVNLGEVRHSPEEVYQWQQKFTDIGFSFDSIPFKRVTGRFTGWAFDGVNFIPHAKKSRENIDACIKYKTRNDFMYYGIIQGRQYDEYQQWLKIIDCDFLDGYCVKTSNNNPVNLAETAIFAIHNLHKPVHFLGVGNQSKSLIAIYASQFIQNPISFDSSSYDIGTQFRSYLLPNMMNRKIRFVNPANVDKHESGDYDGDLCNVDSIFSADDLDSLSEFCNCSVCTNVDTKIKNMIKDNDPILGGLISVHNLIMNINWNNYMIRIIKKREKLMEFINFNFDINLATKIIDGIEMIDLSIDKGPEYALDKYKDKITLNRDITAQKNIFEF